jgi:hypothetical protein
VNAKQAKEILKDCEIENDALFCESFGWINGNPDIMSLEGYFNIEQLEAILYFMKHPGKFK